MSRHTVKSSSAHHVRRRDCLTPFSSTMATSHSFDFSNLTPSTTYTFRVRSKDATGNSAVSSDQIFTTNAPPVAPPTTAPSAPSNLVATCNGATQVTLKWSPVSAASSYYLRVNDQSKANPIPYDYVLDGITQTTFTANVNPGHQYIWWVHAANDVGLSSSTKGSFTCPGQ